jgi:hypothetical protein
MAKAKKKKKKTQKGLVGKTTGVGVCATWLVAFNNKKLTTAVQVTEFMKKEFPDRDSKIFNYPNVVVGRTNKGLLTKGKKPKTAFKKYPTETDKKKKQV